MIHNFKSGVNKLTNETLATLSLRTIEAVSNSGIEQAQTSKQFIALKQVNDNYQTLFAPRSQKLQSEQINICFAKRQGLFKSIVGYTSGLLNSPDASVKQSAVEVARILTAHGSTIAGARIAEQTIRYIRVIEMLKAENMVAHLEKLQLSERVDELDRLQREYENLYTGRGNDRISMLYPSAMRKRMVEALSLHYEETCWMAIQHDTDAWKTLIAVIEKRLSEVKTSRKSSSKTSGAESEAAQGLQSA